MRQTPSEYCIASRVKRSEIFTGKRKSIKTWQQQNFVYTKIFIHVQDKKDIIYTIVVEKYIYVYVQGRVKSLVFEKVCVSVSLQE